VRRHPRSCTSTLWSRWRGQGTPPSAAVPSAAIPASSGRRCERLTGSQHSSRTLVVFGRREEDHRRGSSQRGMQPRGASADVHRTSRGARWLRK
jgi:hypothetical protein